MLMKNIKINTVSVFLFSVVFIWLFFFCKHNPPLSEVNVFNVDPYDAVGSIAIQISFAAAFFSTLRIFAVTNIEVQPSYHLMMILRGNLVSLLSILVTMISEITALVRFRKIWINSSSGILLSSIIISFMVITVLMIFWTLKLDLAKKIKIRYNVFSLKNLWSLAGFIIIAFYPVTGPFKKSILWAVFTAYLGMAIQIMIVRNLVFLIFPPEKISGSDLISVMNEVYLGVKSRITFLKFFFDYIEKGLKNMKAKPLINWLNPRKHRWTLIILIILFSGTALAFLEGFGEEWIGFTKKSVLLFSVYLGGESVIILLFYGLFGTYLGMVNREKIAHSNG
jgi:hypothetical protein